MLRHRFLRRVLATLAKVETTRPGVMWRARSKPSAGTLRSSKWATKCSARALERLPSMRAVEIVDCRLPIAVWLMDHLNYRINDMNPNMNLPPVQTRIDQLMIYLLELSSAKWVSA
jgi:hypothetical protein